MLTLAVGYALFVLLGIKSPPEAKKTRKQPAETFVTHEELEEALDKHRKDLEWEWTEMYEKFEKLHLRLAKREKREQEKDQRQLPLSGNDDEPDGSVSIIHLRKQGSL